MDHLSKQVYRIAPELRRCCWYMMIGFTIIAAAAVWLVQNFAIVPPERVIPLVSCYGLVVVAASLPLTWSLRVEKEGIRRRWLGLSDFWSWDEFASGRLVKRHCYTLLNPSRPWWRRRLRLGWMSDHDIKQVIGVINTHYQLPPPPEVPVPLVLKYGFRRSATFDEKGIHLLVRGVPKEFLWNEVEGAHIYRMDPLRRDFALLQLKLPDELIELTLVTHQGGTSPTWSGASADELNELMFAHLPRERIHVSVAGERITHREYLERALAEAKKNRNFLRAVLILVAALSLGLLIYLVVMGNWAQGLCCGLMLSIGYAPIVAGFYLRVRRNVIELQANLASLDGGA